MIPKGHFHRMGGKEWSNFQLLVCWNSFFRGPSRDCFPLRVLSHLSMRNRKLSQQQKCNQHFATSVALCAISNPLRGFQRLLKHFTSGCKCVSISYPPTASRGVEAIPEANREKINLTHLEGDSMDVTTAHV